MADLRAVHDLVALLIDEQDGLNAALSADFHSVETQKRIDDWNQCRTGGFFPGGETFKLLKLLREMPDFDNAYSAALAAALASGSNRLEQKLETVQQLRRGLLAEASAGYERREKSVYSLPTWPALNEAIVDLTPYARLPEATPIQSNSATSPVEAAVPTESPHPRPNGQEATPNTMPVEQPAAVTPAIAANEPPDSKSKKPVPRIKTNTLMIDKITANTEAKFWSAGQWSAAIKRSKSSVHGAPIWKELEIYREQLRVERGIKKADRRRRKKHISRTT